MMDVRMQTAETESFTQSFIVLSIFLVSLARRATFKNAVMNQGLTKRPNNTSKTKCFK